MSSYGESCLRWSLGRERRREGPQRRVLRAVPACIQSRMEAAGAKPGAPVPLSWTREEKE